MTVFLLFEKASYCRERFLAMTVWESVASVIERPWKYRLWDEGLQHGTVAWINQWICIASKNQGLRGDSRQSTAGIMTTHRAHLKLESDALAMARFRFFPKCLQACSIDFDKVRAK